MDGFILIDKPRGWTSRQVVDCVAKVVRTRRVGHAGTLDPIATGLVVVCVGKATRLTQFLHLGVKEYQALFQLGATSPTDDADGPISEVVVTSPPSEGKVHEVLKTFVGRIMQQPPAFSAIKLGGKRAYDLARQGKDPQLKPRPVEIYAIDLIRYEFPWLEIGVRCGPGTYIRALGRDIGSKLGTGAVMHGLVRSRLGPFHLKDALRPDKLTAETAARELRPLQAALADLPQAVLGHAEAAALLHGQKVRIPGALADDRSGRHVAVYDSANNLLGVAIATNDGFLQPVVNLRSPGEL